MGTISSTEEVLVGYQFANYVTIDALGNVSTKTIGALGTMEPSGDLVAIGQRGFLSVKAGGPGSGTSCSSSNSGDCIIEVDLRSGEPLAGGFFLQVRDKRVFGLGQSEGRLLLFENAEKRVYSVDLVTKVMEPIADFPTNANFTGAGSAPYDRL